MKKYLKIAVIFTTLFLVVGGYFIFANRQEWKTYTNTDPVFSFSYPKSWGEPEIYQNKEKDEFDVSFGNSAFMISNGYYFMEDVNGKRPTVPQLVQSYKDDMNAKNEIKDFQVVNIQVDNHSAIKVSANNLNGSHYNDVYIYQDNQNPDKFILITGNRTFVDDATFNKVLSTFRFSK